MGRYSGYMIITDLDGTVLKSDKSVPEKNIRAIESFKAGGGLFSVATGRSFDAGLRYVKLLAANAPSVLYNGGMIYDPVKDSIISEIHLHPSAKAILSEILDEFPDASAEILSGREIYIVRSNELEAEHMKLLGVKFHECGIEDVPDGWIKILFAVDESLMKKMSEFVAKKGYDTVDFVASSEHYYEMLPKGGSKGSAIKRIRELYNGDIKIIAAGDYNNDIEMITEADIGVAVANAVDDVKKAADVVLKSTNEDGIIAEIIENILDLT